MTNNLSLEDRVRSIEVGANFATSGIVFGATLPILTGLKTDELPRKAFVGGTVGAILCGLGGYAASRFRASIKSSKSEPNR